MTRRVFAVLCAVVAASLGAAALRQILTGSTLNLAAASGPAHILVVMEENHGYSGTLGDCAADPYLCSLASGYASATGWYGVTHPSEPNYVAIGSGGIQGCTTDTSCAADSLPATDLGGQLTAAGIPWVGWMESMPSACYTGSGYNSEYALKHNPFAFFKDNYVGACHIQPYPGATAAVSALDGSNAPDFVWITPNLQDDMHNGTVQQGDAWLKANLPGILTSSWFRDYPSTVIVTMDEGDSNPNGSLSTEQGGHIPTVAISLNAQGKGPVNLSGDHYGTLRSIEEAYRLTPLGSAADAANGDLSGLFGGAAAPSSSSTGTPTPSPSHSPSSSPSATGSPTAVPSPSSTPTPPGPPRGGAGRNPLDQPFASNSIWNMPIGTAATYSSAGLVKPVRGLASDNSAVFMDPAATMTSIEQGPQGQRGNRCQVGGSVLVDAPLPPVAILNNTDNEAAGIVAANGSTLVQANHFARCTPGQPATAASVNATQSLYGDGRLGNTGGSGLDTIGGVTRVGDLAPGTVTRHALSVNVYGAQDLYKASASLCYTWPATRCDAYGPSRYGGTNPALRMGSLLAIPVSQLANLPLTTTAGRQLAWTLAYYGAYVVNDSARSVFAVRTEQGDADFLASFQQEWGFSFATVGTGVTGTVSSAWASDLQTIISRLAVVTDNGPSAVGGGGSPLQPLAAPLAGQTSSSAPLAPTATPAPQHADRDGDRSRRRDDD